MKNYQVYLNNDFLYYQLMGVEPNHNSLQPSVLIQANSLDEVFIICNSDSNPLPRSLSVGDVVGTSLTYYILTNDGWERWKKY